MRIIYAIIEIIIDIKIDFKNQILRIFNPSYSTYYKMNKSVFGMQIFAINLDLVGWSRLCSKSKVTLT